MKRLHIAVERRAFPAPRAAGPRRTVADRFVACWALAGVVMGCFAALNLLGSF